MDACGGSRKKQSRADMAFEPVSDDYMQSKKSQVNTRPGGPALDKSNGTPILFVDSTESLKSCVNNTKGKARDQSDGASGPLLLGLTNLTTQATLTEQVLSPTINKPDTPVSLKVYPKSKWRKKQ